MPCHNDLLNANFIDDGERLVIVDWEYAGMGDPFFDLANFSINHELDAEGRAVLLAAYAGDAHAAGLAALDLMRFMSDFREAMWGVVQGVVSELDFDFGALRGRALRADGADGDASRRSAARSATDDGGAPRTGAPPDAAASYAEYLVSAGTSNSVAVRSSICSSSSSVPIRTGPLNQFFAEMQPPAAEEQERPADRERRVVRDVPVEAVLPRDARRRDRARGRGSR